MCKRLAPVHVWCGPFCHNSGVGRSGTLKSRYCDHHLGLDIRPGKDKELIGADCAYSSVLSPGVFLEALR